MHRAVAVVIGFVLTTGAVAHADAPADSVFCGGAPEYAACTPVPDPLNLYHVYGTRLGEFNIGSEFAAFDNTFVLYVMDGVVSRWTPDSVRVFCDMILNDDPNDTSDVFPRIWAYFCTGDEDPSYEGISVTIEGDVLDKIPIYLYDNANIPCPNAAYTNPCFGFGAEACYGRSYAPGCLNVVINASEFKVQEESDPAVSDCSLRTVESVVRRGFSHEVQHACFNASGRPEHYRDANESLSTLAEWMVRADQEKGYDVAYDASIFRGEKCDGQEKYYVEQVWMTYLFEAYDQGTSSITDDLVYRWLRKEVDGQKRITMRQLAAVLAEPDFAWVGGSTGDERLSNVFQAFAVAKFCNAPLATSDGRFGYSDYDPMREVAMFKDECTWYAGLYPPVSQQPVPPPLDCPGAGVPLPNRGCWNVRILPPDFVLDGSYENSPRLITGLFTLENANSPAFDGSHDLIDVAIYGTDYLIFRADDYYQTGGEHEFHFELRGLSPAPAVGDLVKVWAVGYDTADGPLNQQPANVIFIEPVLMTNGTASLVVNNFGGAVKSVVIVVTMVEAVANDRTSGMVRVDDYFTYEYEFGVYTRTTTAGVTWAGTVLLTGDVAVSSTKTLTIAPGSMVRIATADASAGGTDTQRIEFNVSGLLIADGTAANPIAFESWNPTTTEDWVGFYFDNSSVGGFFDNCRISRAEYAIESYKPVAIKNTIIEDCRYGAVIVQAGNAVIEGCTVTRPGTFGVFLTTASTTVRNTVIDDAVSTACHVQPNATVVARNSQFLNSDKGLYIGGNLSANVDSTCAFNGNVVGIHCYNTASTPVIMNSTINSNSTSGILCDNMSHPLIQGNTIRYNGSGVSCANNSSPLIAQNIIKSNTTGVGVASGSDPDIGHCCSSGDNEIAYSTSYHVANFNAFTIFAQNNCWNVQTTAQCGNPDPCCRPKAQKILGPVDTSAPQCCSVPSGSQTFELPEPEPEPVLVTDLTRAFPNPFNPTTTIHYQVAAPGAQVEMTVYDVAGRLVRVLLQGFRAAGAYQAVWTGVDSNGVPVASSVYFVKMSAGSQTRTLKVVLLK